MPPHPGYEMQGIKPMSLCTLLTYLHHQPFLVFILNVHSFTLHLSDHLEGPRARIITYVRLTFIQLPPGSLGKKYRSDTK